MNYALSRRAVLDVNWANLFDANTKNFQHAHHNPYYELIVIADGTVDLQAGEEQMTLHAGEMLLLMPWEQHRCWNQKVRQGQFFWVQFSCTPVLREFVSAPAQGLDFTHATQAGLRTEQIKIEAPILLPRRFQTPHRYKLLGLFEQLVEVFSHPRGYFQFQAALLLGEILLTLANDFLAQQHAQTAFPPSYSTFLKLVTKLNNQYNQEIVKGKLEKLLDRKYEYLCQLFKKYAGITIHNYVHQLRVQEARHLLENTERTIKDIAETVGYQDPFHFSHVFKRHEGCSPQHFRNRRKANTSSAR